MKTKLYACINKNEEVRRKSSSGGVYSLIAESIIAENGIVYAACYDENLEVCHRRITILEEIEASRGSKYVSSKLGNTFSEIRTDLQDNKKVLFVGTPCQCGGLLSFLQGKTDNLICMDFICHGVPGRTAWRAYLGALRNRGMDLQRINMRDKSTGWSKYHYSWHFVEQNGKETYQLQNENPYMRGFIRDLYLRPSCMNCRFKGINRKTDFTLGDYWGCWRLQPDMDDDKGTSLVMVHSEKGKALFEKIAKEIIYEDVTEENAVKYNPSIIRSSVSKSEGERKYFNDCMRKKKDFITVVEHMTSDSLIAKIHRKLRKLFC